ncbi:MAG TPA: hypothetical protein VEI02_14880 [Planctomycetota bacterium]|nr:hypothetical protein [Planctomycetota bacterium]
MTRSRTVVTWVTLAACSAVVSYVADRTLTHAPAAGVDGELRAQAPDSNLADVASSSDGACGADAKSAQLQKFPLMFAENRGQFDAVAKYSARYRGINAFVTAEGYRFGLFAPEALRMDPRADDPWANADLSKAANVFFTFEGASPNVAVVGEGPLATRFNYFLGPDAAGWRTDVPTFASVRHKAVYPGIDVVLGDRDGRLEYDLVLKPGADLSQVRIRVDGAEGGLEAEEGGGLLTRTRAGPFQQTAPVAFVRRADGSLKTVPCRFRLLGENVFGFEADGWDATEELVVDPGLVFAYLVTGSVADQANGVSSDPVLNSYIGGRTSSANFPATPGAFDVTLTSGNFDAFLAKIDPVAGVLTYCTFIGASGMDYVSALRADSAGNLYATGQAGSSGFPTTAGAYDTSYNGQGDGFVTKLSPTGNSLVYSTVVGGSFEERIHGLAVDAAGAAYIVGQTLSHTNYPGTSTQTIPIGANNSVGAINWNTCVTKVNAGGASLGYSFRTGGDGSDWAYAVAVDAAGAAYVVGATSSTNHPTSNAFDATPNGGFDAFAFKVGATGSSFVFCTLLGGPGADQAFGVDVDATGAAYVVGNAGIGFPTTAGAWDVTGDGSDGFVTKLQPAGNALQFSTYLGGTSSDQINGIKVDHGLRPVVVGWTNSASFPTTASGYDTTYGGGGSPAEGFLTKLTWNGTGLLYSSFIGGNGNDECTGVSLDSNGWAYVGGTANGSSAATFLPGAWFSGGVGAEEAWTAKFELPASPSVTLLGQGCSATAPLTPLPTFNLSLPTLGEMLTFSGQNAAPAGYGYVLMSFAPNYALPISPTCTLYFDPTSVMAISTYLTNTSGNWSQQFFLVNNPSWVGAVLRMQALTYSAATPWGFELTNGLDAEIGY